MNAALKHLKAKSFLEQITHFDLLKFTQNDTNGTKVWQEVCRMHPKKKKIV